MQTTDEGTSPKTWAIIVWALYLLSGVTGLTCIAGLIVAYLKRSDLAGTPYESHMIYAIRTFWIGLLIGVIGVILIFVVIGVPVLIALAIWSIYRMVRGLVCALDGRAISNPKSWL
jgi:uncharacterized membrane protein